MEKKLQETFLRSLGQQEAEGDETASQHAAYQYTIFRYRTCLIQQVLSEIDMARKIFINSILYKERVGMNKPKNRNAIRVLAKAVSTDKGKQWARFGLGLLIFPVSVLFLSLLTPASWRQAFIAFQIKLFLFAAMITASYIAFPRMRQFLHFGLERFRTFDQCLNTSQRLYRSVLLLGVSILVLAQVGPGPWMPPLVWAFFAFCVFVALFDALRWYQSMSEHALGKAVIGLGFASASTFAYAIARQEIAEVTHVTPSNFIHTTLLMAIFTIPVLIVLAGGVVYLTCMIASMVVVPFSLLARDAPSGLKAWLFAGLIKDNPTKHPIATKIFQFFFYGTLGLCVLRMGGTIMLRYELELQKRLPSSVYYLDMYQGQECKLQPGEKLAPLGDSKFLIGKSIDNGHIEFQPPVKCEDLPSR